VAFAERRAVSAAGGARSLDDVGGEALVDEAHDHRSSPTAVAQRLTDPRVNIAHREDAGHTRLQDALAPALRLVRTNPSSSSTDRATEPVGVRCGSEEEEEGGERDPLAVAVSSLLHQSR
jgi:hypothetical protein